MGDDIRVCSSLSDTTILQVDEELTEKARLLYVYRF